MAKKEVDQNQAPLRILLRREIASRKLKNTRVSERSVAISLGLSPGELSDFLKKKRNFSASKIYKVLEKIKCATPASIGRALVEMGLAPLPAVPKEATKEILAIYGEVCLLTIFQLYKNDIRDPVEIAERLGIKLQEAKRHLATIESFLVNVPEKDFVSPNFWKNSERNELTRRMIFTCHELERQALDRPKRNFYHAMVHVFVSKEGYEKLCQTATEAIRKFSFPPSEVDGSGEPSFGGKKLVQISVSLVNTEKNPF